MKKLTINRQVEKKIHKGYKILEKSDFGQLPFDNEVVELLEFLIKKATDLVA